MHQKPLPLERLLQYHGHMNSGFLLFKREGSHICGIFPELIYSETDEGEPFITGEIILRDKMGKDLDSYFIRIEPIESYPYKFPIVFETGERVPVNIDWHVYPDGHCCIKSIPEESLICKNGITLAWFIDQQLMPYFFNQKFRELNGYFLNERSHGVKGNIEFFEEVFRTKDLKTISMGLIYIRERNELDRVSECFCGSGLKYRKCHRDTFKILSEFSDNELDQYIKMTSEYIRY